MPEIMYPDVRVLRGDFGRDGAELLQRTSYRRATALEERRVCAGRSVAFTTVGGSSTGLCRAFSRLSVERTAATLLHEAPHFAGLDESPQSPGAPTSGDINRIVAEGCRL